MFDLIIILINILLNFFIDFCYILVFEIKCKEEKKGKNDIKYLIMWFVMYIKFLELW